MGAGGAEAGPPQVIAACFPGHALSHTLVTLNRTRSLPLPTPPRAISCGAEHTVAVTPEDVITWGSNEHGQCGHGEKAEMEWVKPRSIKMLHEQMVTQVGAAGRAGEGPAQRRTACWLLERQRFVWRGVPGQRAAGGRACAHLPAVPPCPVAPHPVPQVICGKFHTLCVTATSQVYAWGRNGSGQLGLGDTADRRSPALVEGLWALPVLQLAAGALVWGGGRSGQLLRLDLSRAGLSAWWECSRQAPGLLSHASDTAPPPAPASLHASRQASRIAWR